MKLTIDEIIDNFSLIEDWEDRYRYVIELGRMLEPLPEAAHSDANKVQGCASQVWLLRESDGAGPDPVLRWRGDSDAHIVRGLIAILLALFSGRTARQVLEADALALFKSLGLSDHLTPQRSNGVRAMVERIKADARSVFPAKPEPMSAPPSPSWERGRG